VIKKTHQHFEDYYRKTESVLRFFKNEVHHGVQYNPVTEIP
jgi:hypothetical protein